MDQMIHPAEVGWDFRTPTDPRKIVLLIGLPLSRVEFVEDYRRWPNQDFARFSSADEEPEVAWATSGTHLAQVTEALIHAADASGMSVARKATAVEFERAFTYGAKVVVLIAHWRGSRLAGRDLLIEPEACARAVQDAAPSGVALETLGELRRRVAAALDETPTDISPSLRRSHFAGRLNQLVIRGLPLLPRLIEQYPGEELVVGELWLETLHRDMLDLCAGGTILLGNRVELRDGLHSPSSLAELVPEQWHGLIDLGMCRSLILGHMIKQGRSDRGMIVRTRTVDPSFTLTLMRRLFLELGTATLNYATRYAELFSAARCIMTQIVSDYRHAL